MLAYFRKVLFGQLYLPMAIFLRLTAYNYFFSLNCTERKLPDMRNSAGESILRRAKRLIALSNAVFALLR
jgi:hypothetical protein